MKTSFYLFNAFILINFLILTKEDVCEQNQITISGLGKCEDIRNILENENLKLKTQNLLYLA